MLWEKYKWSLKKYWPISLFGGVGVSVLTYSMPKDLLGRANPNYHKTGRAIGWLLGATLLPPLAVALTTSDEDYEAMRRLLG